MAPTQYTFSTNHNELIAGLKKAGILSPAVVDYPGSVFELNLHLTKTLGRVLTLRADGKAYVLRKWVPPTFQQLLEAYFVEQKGEKSFCTSNGIRVTIKR